MALITCPDCGKRVSSEADRCPECGYPIRNIRIQENDTTINKETNPKKDHTGLIVLGIILTIVSWPIGIIFWIVYSAKMEKPRKIKEKSDMEKILIKNAKIDALASIDPTKPDEAKKKIDIVNKLDNL